MFCGIAGNLKFLGALKPAMDVRLDGFVGAIGEMKLKSCRGWLQSNAQFSIVLVAP